MTLERFAKRSWHSIEETELSSHLKTDLKSGLSKDEASKRLKELGFNEIKTGNKRTLLQIFISQLKSPLVYLLFAACIITFFLGELSDPFVILAVVVLNALMGTVQEARAQKALSALRKLTPTKVRVIRDGKERSLAKRDLTVGDLLVLSEGDLVGADARLLVAEELKIDQSTLTGESVAIDKDEGILTEETSRSDRTNIVYAGTHVVSGRGVALVVGIGGDTEIGRIAALSAEAPQRKTPIEERIETLGKQIATIAIVLFFGLIGIGYLNKLPFVDIVLAAVSQMVSFVPEGLPVAMTIALAIGVQKMARRGAIVRQLVAVETLGSTDVICTDKTGTLTMNEMRVVEVLMPDGKRTEQIGEEAKDLLIGAVLCTDAKIEGGQELGDPTETALLRAGTGIGLEKEALLQQYPRIGEIPFNSKEKVMVTFHQKNGETFAVAKGAWEKISSLCRESSGLDRQIEQMAEEGLRTLAVARFEGVQKGMNLHELSGMGTLLGIVAELDPLRPEVQGAVTECKEAGIRPIVITGDHRKTGFAIANQAHIAHSEKEVIEGGELEHLSEQELENRIETYRVFARVYPEQKLNIVKALQKKGHVVAMTGDGVNDGPALATSDVGVAMGKTGSEVAKQVAKMVITDDNFATIVSAVREGRVVFANLKKVVSYLFSTSLSAVLLLFIAISLGFPLPLAAVQILWINVVTEGVVTINLILDPEEGDEMKKPPVKKKEPLFSRVTYARIATVTPVIALLLLGNFFWLLKRGAPLVQLQTETFMLLAICAWLNVMSCRSSRTSVFDMPLFPNKWLAIGLGLGIVLQLAVIYVPFLQEIFHTVALGPFQLIKLLVLGSVALWTEELRKLAVRTFSRSV